MLETVAPRSVALQSALVSRALRLIPVIDLMAGEVVRGMGGDRASYRPIVSALCRSSDPLTVACRLVDHCATDQLYVADLDALMGGPVQLSVLQALLAGLPDVTLWVDAGFADTRAAAAMMKTLGPPASPTPATAVAAADRIVPVFASESLPTREALEACFPAGHAANGQGALSLDRRGNRRLDPAGCWDAPGLWPHRVIVMTLERVGSAAGPDLATMAELRRTVPGAMLIGAGGIRGEADLASAAAAGADGWLVASALHDLQIAPVRR